MKNFVKNYWGFFPFAIYLLLQVVVSSVNKICGFQLRNMPVLFLYWFAVISILVIFLWVALSIYKGIRSKRVKGYNILDKLVLVLFALIGVFVVFFSVLICSFFNTEERIVTKNNIKMVASYNNFNEEKVNYYEYKNSFVYGKNFGFEIYLNSELKSPLSDDFNEKPISWIFYDLDGNVIDSSNNKNNKFKKIDLEVKENREKELVFNFSIDDFINNYNKYYSDDKGSTYLKPSLNWQVNQLEKAVHSKYKMDEYRFKEDENKWSLPILSVYVPENSNYVEEVIVNFDDHGHTEEMYNIYEEICFYTLKVFFPDLPNDKIISLYKEINELAYEKTFPKEQDYDDDIVPYSVYIKGNVGVYPYYAVGDYVRLCIIPVNDETIKEFKEKGVNICEIQ